MKGKLAVLTAIFLLFCKGTYMNASDITTKTKIRDIISDPGLGDLGRLLFPVNEGVNSIFSLNRIFYKDLSANLEW